MRRHRTTTLLSLVIALALAACGSAAGQGAGSALSTHYADSLPVAGQLAAGTLKLDSSELAVTAAQAGELLPLWQGLQSLLTSSTSSSQEIQGLVSQIESTMTADQVKAIAAMELTQSDATSLTQNSATSSTTSGGSSGIQATRRAQSSGDFGPPGGAFVGGGPGGDGLGIGLAAGNGLPGSSSSGIPQATLSADSQATAQAYSNQFAQVGVSPVMIRVVIQYLQSKAG